MVYLHQVFIVSYRIAGDICGLGHIREFEVPIPPIGEQERIMEEVDDRVSLFNRLENEIDAATIKASKARQSILTQAFDGRLSDKGQG